MKSRGHKKHQQRAAQSPPESDEQRLRNLITVSLDDDEPQYQAVDEFSDEFLLQVPSPRR